MGRVVLFLLPCFLFILFSPSLIFASIQFQIDSPNITNNEITLNASISGLISTSCLDNKCYLQGAIRQSGTSAYFGQTKGPNNWVDYVSSPEVEYLQSSFFNFQPESGSWSGQINLRFLVDDQDYHGPGDYELKVRRFTGKSTSPSGESNTLVLTLSLPTPTPLPTSTPSPPVTSTPSSTATSVSTPTSFPTLTSSPTPSLSPTAIILTTSPTASTSAVLGESTDSAKVNPTNINVISDQTNTFRLDSYQIVALVVILIGGIGLVYSLKYSSWSKP